MGYISVVDPISLPALSLGAGNDSGVHELAADLAILQDAINTLAASAQNGASEQSTLSAFPSVNTDVHTGSGIVSWGLDASDGSAISIDGSDPTQIHVTAGAYMVSVQGFINGTGTINSINVGGTGIQTGDGATGGGSPQLILVRASVDTTFHVQVTVTNPGGSDHFNGGMDVFRI